MITTYQLDRTVRSAFKRESSIERQPVERWALEKAAMGVELQARSLGSKANITAVNRPERFVPNGSTMNSEDSIKLGAARSEDVVIASKQVNSRDIDKRPRDALPSMLAGRLVTMRNGALASKLTSSQQNAKPRMGSSHFPPLWAGGHGEPPPDLWVTPGQRPKWFQGEPFYGNWYGPYKENAGEPISPVDLAAYYHDFEYGDIQSHYTNLGPDASPWDLWFEPWTRIDEPQYLYDLAMADLRINENILLFTSRGLSEGFYRGNPGLLASDLIAGGLAYLGHSALAGLRLVFYAGYSILDSFGEFFSGEINFGQFIERIMQSAANVIVGGLYWAVGTINGLANLAVSSVKAVITNPGGAAAGAAIGGVIAGPVGAVIGAVIGGGGCYLTTAVCMATGLSDKNEYLQTLRHYRDNYLVRRPGGSRDIQTYYAMSPKVVDQINSRPDSDRIWLIAFTEYIVPAVASIRAGKYEKAYHHYKMLFIRMLRESRLSGKLYDQRFDENQIGLGKPYV